ncbi:MAG: hypothetical protein OEZ02_06745 [Anaerolineae bacterium]|nr:hypothetical protein [Anaerolineae bacterium]
MRSTLATLLGIVRYQLRDFLRTRYFGVIAALLLALSLVFLELPELAQKYAVMPIFNVAAYLGSLGGILLFFMLVPQWIKEFHPGADMVWSREIPTPVFFFAKIVASLIGVFLAYFPALLLNAAVLCYYFGSFSLRPLGQLIAIILLPQLVLIISLSVLVSLTLQKPLWSYVVLFVLWIGLPSVYEKVPWWNISLRRFFPSPVIGFGPHTELVFWNRLYIYSVSLILLVAAFSFFRLIEPRIKNAPSGLARLLILGSMIALCILSGQSIRNMAAISRVSFPASNNEDLLISSVALEAFTQYIEVDLAQEILWGKSEITFVVHQPITTLHFNLNPGLQVDRVSIPGRTGVSLIDQGVIITPTLNIGELVTLIIHYQGILKPDQNRPNLFQVPDRHQQNATTAYLGQGTFFMAAPGNWSPFSESLLPHRLELVLTGVFPEMVSNADDIRDLPKGKQLVWNHIQPGALVALSSSYRQFLVGDAVVYSPTDYEHLLDIVAPVSASIVGTMETAFLGEAQGKAISIAIVPFNQLPQYSLGDGLIFLPENYFRMYASLSATQNYEAPIIFKRLAAEIMMRAWWCQYRHCFIQPVMIGDYMEGDEDAITPTILSFMALKQSQALLGESFAASEIQARRARVLDNIFFFTPNDVIFPSLGISNALFVRLNDLWNQLGQDAFLRLVISFDQTYADGQLSIDEFEQFVFKQSGVALPPLNSDSN